MDEGESWHVGRPLPRSHCVRRGPPIFGQRLLCPNGWTNQDATWYRGRPRYRPRCVRCRTISPKMGSGAPIYGPCLLWPNGGRIKIPLDAGWATLWTTNSIIFIAILPSFQTSFSNRHFAPLSSSDFHAVTGVILYIILRPKLPCHLASSVLPTLWQIIML